MDCRSARVALDMETLDPVVQEHVAGCVACTNERRIALGLRSALVVEAPPELSARLIALASAPPQPTRLDVALERALVAQAPPELVRRLALLVPGASPVQRASRRWVMPVYAATALLLSVLLVIAGRVYGMALQELGVTEVWYTVGQLPGEWLNQFYAFFPQGRYVVAAFFSLQRALQWVLVGLLMWAVLELQAPRLARTRA